MRHHPTAISLCVIAATTLLASPQAFGFGKKSKNLGAKTELTQPVKDVSRSIDELLGLPVQSAATQRSEPAPVTPAEKLQGSVEATDANGNTLQGQTDESGIGLRSGASADVIQGQPLKAKTDNTVLKGCAVATDSKLGTQQDPDIQDRELMVEWDRWRNKFLRAVQLQVQASVNHPDGWEEDSRPTVAYDPISGQAVVQPRFPMGTEAWFHCDITVDRKVKNLSIIRSSGIQAYDKAVIEGVRALEGTSLLQYPGGSRRTVVAQSAGIRTASSSDFQYHQFGDVERVREQR